LTRWCSITVACALGALVAALSGCVSDRCTGMSAPTPKEPEPAKASPGVVAAPQASPPSTVPDRGKVNMNPALEFIPEMGTYPQDLSGAAPSLTAEEREAFASAWRRVAPDVEAGVTSAK